jgi:hypothetical protein
MVSGEYEARADMAKDRRVLEAGEYYDTQFKMNYK